MKKIYFLFILCCLNFVSFATQYFPSSATAPYAGTAQTVCIGSLNTATTITYSVCGTSSGTALQTLTVTPTWYLNGAIVYTGATFVSVTGGGAITLPAGSFTYTAAGAFTGANGLKCTLTWPTAAPGGCSAATTVTGSATNVTVTPAPAAITGPSMVCVGSSISLSDATAGGTWSSSNSSVATCVIATGSVTGASIGITAINYELGVCTVIHSVTVTEPPTAITGPSKVCAGSTITLSDAIPYGTWSSSSVTVAFVTGSSPVVTGVSADTAVITYSTGCGSNVTTTVVVNPLPLPIIGITRVCTAMTTSLSDATAGGTWSSGIPTVATVNPGTGVVYGVVLGNTPITYSLPTTCLVTTTATVTHPPSAISGLNTVCDGQTITLSDNFSGGYWSSSSSVATVGSASGVVTGATLGMPVISYTMGSACFAVMSVTVNPRAPITGSDSICNGSTTYLADIVGGGTWASSLASAATIGSLSGFVTAVSPGISHITYTTSLGCISTSTMTVIAIPAAITGITHTCPGSSITLHDASPGGIWTSSNNSVATVASSGGTGTVYGVFADTTNIIFTVRPGCSVQTLVLVDPLPAPIVGNSALCATTVDSFYDASPGGLWSTTTPTLATINDTSGIASVLSGGTAVIVYTLPATGCKITDNVTVYPLPVPVITYNWMTQSFYLNNVYSSYQWYDSLQGLIPGANSPTLAALYTEYYYVVVTDSLGCAGSSALYEFDAALLGIANHVNDPINIYPNPANTIVYIASPVNVRAIVTSIDGKQQLEQPNAKEIDVSKLADGMYFITLYADNGQVMTIRKLIKQ